MTPQVMRDPASIRDRGSILGASTGAEVLNVLALAPQRGGRLVAMLGQLPVDGIDFALGPADAGHFDFAVGRDVENRGHVGQDRKSTRLNSSHANISYAVFCL